MLDEYDLFGPPGCGKTTFLATSSVPKAVEKYGPEKVMITSFTRTAAREIATKPSKTTGMTVDVPAKNIGTLHSICFRALENPIITEVKCIKEWNESHSNYLITGKTVDVVDECNNEESGALRGDMLLNTINIKRNKLIPESMWTNDLRRFKKAWDDFKTQTNSIDFTGLIEKSLAELPYAPGNPEMMFVDEAQDFTKLQLSLVRSWGINMDRIMLVGDDDQCIYRFSGASPEAFLRNDVPEDRKMILAQSYRVPKAVHERSSVLLSRIKNRQVKQYLPRTELFSKDAAKGSVVDFDDATWNSPAELVDIVKDRISKETHASRAKVMIIASCSYMLDPIRAVLLENGIPFHNPYRMSGKGRGWNPLMAGDGNINTGRDILEAFIECGADEPYWNIPQFYTWAKHIKTGADGWLSGRKQTSLDFLKTAIEQSRPGLHTTRDIIGDLLSVSAIDKALNRDLSWFEENLMAGKVKSLAYPINTYKKFGMKAISAEPSVIIGTIHSVKGGEAESVILFPDLSWKANAEKETKEGYESLNRLFYVGMTRAYDELILCRPSSKSPNIESRLYMELK